MASDAKNASDAAFAFTKAKEGIFQLFFFYFPIFLLIFMIYICRVMPRCRSCIAGALHRTYEDAGFFWMQPGIRHLMPRLVNAKPKKVPASSYVRCQDAAPLSKRSLLPSTFQIGTPI